MIEIHTTCIWDSESGACSAVGLCIESRDYLPTHHLTDGCPSSLHLCPLFPRETMTTYTAPQVVKP